MTDEKVPASPRAAAPCTVPCAACGASCILSPSTIHAYHHRPGCAFGDQTVAVNPLARPAAAPDCPVREALQRLVTAMNVCESIRGAFSCADPHDCRCPKSRSPDGSTWRGEWRCQCGREELDAAISAAENALAAPCTLAGTEPSEAAIEAAYAAYDEWQGDSAAREVIGGMLKAAHRAQFGLPAPERGTAA